MRGHHFLEETVYNSSGTREQFLLSWQVIFIQENVKQLYKNYHCGLQLIPQHTPIQIAYFLNYYILKLHVSDKLNATKLTSQKCRVLAVEYDSLLFLLIQDYQFFGWRMKAENKNENK